MFLNYLFFNPDKVFNCCLDDEETLSKETLVNHLIFMKRVSIETKVWIIHIFSITCCKEKKATYTIKNSSYRWSKSCSDHFFVMKKKNI